MIRFLAVAAFASVLGAGQVSFSVRDYGAMGRKQDDARPGIQKAIDACGNAGGGTVYVPPGEYTSGQLHLRSGVRLYLEAGATIYASLDGRQFDPSPKQALLYGEDLHDIAIEGRGTFDGQASYEWRSNDFVDYYIRPNQLKMEATGKPLLRSFPVGLKENAVYPRLVLLLRCTDVRISGVKFIRSRSWTINPYACKRLTIDGIYVYSSLKEAVWADGIDVDGCQDVRISNSTIETGDDAIVLWSANIWGPALPDENITVTNCRLSSASSALKFCDGNSKAVRRVAVDNVVITNSNRGLAFMVFDGGVVEDVVVSNVTIETRRFDWFWWGDGDPIHFNIKRRSEVDGTKRENEPQAGIIRNISIRNVIAHGAGTSAINGHPDSWLDGVSLDGVKLFVAHDPNAQYEDTRTAMTLRYARNFKMKDVEIHWENPRATTWTTGLAVEDVADSLFDCIAVPGPPSVITMTNVAGIRVNNSRTDALKISGARTRDVRVFHTDAAVTTDPGVPKNAIVR
ncbi:MAG TPA: glycosyl hydrolase family 28 protein [Thermoanaerobaculia bacterium]|nr:glycosyl hydrolase family 28 protein [Thermoanaerobaculia bacterium]